MENQIIPLRELWVRVSPSLEKDRNNIRIIEEQNVILIKHVNDPEAIVKNNNLYLKFEPNGILHNISQETIFTTMIKENLLEKLYDGLNLIVLSFGCTDTGKIHTMFGKNSHNKFRGIVPRLLENIFKCKEKNIQTIKFKISLVFIEINGKDVFNLLKKGKPRCQIQVKPITVDNLDKALAYIFNEGNHKTEDTYKSGGTIVLTINVECSYRRMNRQVKNLSKIHLAVMAGNGEVRGSNILKIEQEGNSVKSQLSTICSWSNDSLNERVPNWRSSKLFTYLGPSLSTSYIRFLGHIQVTTEAIMSTISTLKFAYKLMRYSDPVMVEVTPVTIDKNVYIKELQEEIETIKEIQIMKQITNGVCILDLVSKDEKKKSVMLVNLFLQSYISEYELIRECHPMLFLYAFKNIYNNMSNELQGKISFVTEQLGEIQKVKKKRPIANDKTSVSMSIYSLSMTKTKRKKKRFDTFTLEKADTQNDLKEPSNFSFKINLEMGNDDQEKKELSQNNYKKILQEFLNRNPHLRSRLNAYEEDVSEYFRVRKNKVEEINKIKLELDCIANKEKFLIENNEFLNNQKYMYSHPSLDDKHSINEKRTQILKQKLEQYSLKALNDNKNYVEKRIALNEYMKEVESQFNDYVQKIYSPIFVIAPLEEETNDSSKF